MVPFLRLSLAVLAFLAAGIPLATAAPQNGRVFYDVLGEVLDDFESDVKGNTIQGLDNIAIRNVVVNDSVPASFRDHLDLLLTERVVRNTKTKILQCVACKARRTSFTQGAVQITSPKTNAEELRKIAKDGGIDHFMDATFTYQTTELILSLTVSKSKDGSVIWSHNYNSETSKAALARRGYNSSIPGSTRNVTEYSPSLQYRGMVSYLFEPDTTGLTGCLAFGFRMMERYDNRRKEIGFEANYLKDSSSLIAAAGTSTTGKLYTGINFTLLFVHAWNFIGDDEDYNRVRSGLVAGIGGTFASGYMGSVVRAGWEWRLGKHTSVTTSLGYRPSATALLSSTSASVGGVEFGGGVSMLF